MDILKKAKILADSGRYDSCGPKICATKITKGLTTFTANNEHKDCRMFKTLMSNSCKYDCKYCTNCNNKNKVEFEPQELAKTFNYLQKNLNLNGLFLSSGVTTTPNKTTEKMIEAVKIIRKTFKAYIHFKVLPGTSYELIKQASELCNRMSINIEAPNKSTLNEFSSVKDYKNDILKRQAWIKNLNLPSGQSTQLIVSEHSTDKEIIKMLDWEYEKIKLKRFYFSAFQPVKGTAFENKQAPVHKVVNNPLTIKKKKHVLLINFIKLEKHLVLKNY